MNILPASQFAANRLIVTRFIGFVMFVVTRFIGLGLFVITRFIGLGFRNINRMNAVTTNVAVASILLFCVHLSSSFAHASSDDERFLDGLRSRRLYSVAEAFCREQLTRNDLPPADRAQFTIELIRTFASKAINAPPGERAPFWKQAKDAAAEFVRQERTNPRLVLVRVQDALTVLADAELSRQEAEISSSLSEIPELVRARLREAAKLLEEIDGELVKEIPLRRRVEPKAGELSAEELEALQNNVRYQLARTRRNQALCYGRATDDRISALSQAVDQQTKLLAQLPDDDPLYWRIRLDQVICARLLEDYGRAAELLAAFPPSGVPTMIALEARAEAVRLDLAASKPQEALKILSRGRKLVGQASPEFDYSHLETFLALWQAASEAKNEPESAEWQKRSVGMVKLIEEAHGPYWSRRAELLLVRSARAGTGTKDLEILVRSADDLYLRKQFDEAVSAYENAAEKARAAADPTQAFSLFYKAALVEQQQGRHAVAAGKLQKLSQTMKTHPQAGDAHLLAAWNLARVVEKDPALLDEYAALLDEHLASWPQDKSIGKARLWAGKLREHKKAWNDALGVYLGVPADSPQFDEAVVAAARCAENFLADLKTAGKPFDKEADVIARRFEQLFLNGEGALPEAWSNATRQAALTAARLRLQYTSAGHATASKWLEAALAAVPVAPEAWQAAARSLLVVALAGQPARRGEADQLLEQTAAGSPKQLLEMIDGLSAVSATAKPEAQAEIAQLQLNALKLLSNKGQALDAAGKLAVERVRADALAAAGKRPEAATAYEALVKQHPQDGQLQERYARFLLDGPDAPSWQKALDQWRIVVRGSKPNTDRWYRAKYSVALANFKLGQKKDAAQLIRYMRETPPGLDGTPLKSEFLNLLARCEK